jgi:hypothetical protein
MSRSNNTCSSCDMKRALSVGNSQRRYGGHTIVEGCRIGASLQFLQLNSF